MTRTQFYIKKDNKYYKAFYRNGDSYETQPFGLSIKNTFNWEIKFFGDETFYTSIDIIISKIALDYACYNARYTSIDLSLHNSIDLVAQDFEKDYKYVMDWQNREVKKESITFDTFDDWICIMDFDLKVINWLNTIWYK
jgi:hypothetical protein